VLDDFVAHFSIVARDLCVLPLAAIANGRRRSVDVHRDISRVEGNDWARPLDLTSLGPAMGPVRGREV